MNQFPEIKKNFGFGMMRLPMLGDQVDEAQVCQMVDAFLQRGFNYFDTAHGYIGGKSEIAIRNCLTSRYPREAYVLTNKLSEGCFHSQEDIRPFLNKQLEICGEDYFDFYLMHAQNRKNFQFYKSCRAYETALELKAEGKIHHLGISFHDSAETLDQILTEYPEVEIVQIQFNYLDYEDPGVQGKLCYEVCRKHGKPMLIMEPVKGGRLVNLPPKGKKLYADLENGSPASYALRYVAGFEGVVMTLSGMSNLEQMEDNLSAMDPFVPLNEKEQETVAQVVALLRPEKVISCTACAYCVAGCPAGIAIPLLFALSNDITRGKYAEKQEAKQAYNAIQTGDPTSCIGCGACESICPQHLPIPALLRDVTKTLELRS